MRERSKGRAKVIRFPGAPEPPDRPPSGKVDERGLVEVHRCDQPEAMVVKSLFESEGIPTLLRSRVTHSVHPFTVGAQGEVVILVPKNEVTRTRALLVRLASS
jgi:Putative prokaryotic signal transducing protein